MNDDNEIDDIYYVVDPVLVDDDADDYDEFDG